VVEQEKGISDYPPMNILSPDGAIKQGELPLGNAPRSASRPDNVPPLRLSAITFKNAPDSGADPSSELLATNGSAGEKVVGGDARGRFTSKLQYPENLVPKQKSQSSTPSTSPKDRTLSLALVERKSADCRSEREDEGATVVDATIGWLVTEPPAPEHRGQQGSADSTQDPSLRIISGSAVSSPGSSQVSTPKERSSDWFASDLRARATSQPQNTRTNRSLAEASLTRFRDQEERSGISVSEVSIQGFSNAKSHP